MSADNAVPPGAPSDALRPPGSTATCYFCNEPTDSKYVLEHLLHCGAVLEECPEGCGAYLPRSDLHQHRSQCLSALGRNGDASPAVEPRALDGRFRGLRESAWKSKVVSILGLLRTAVHEGEREVKDLRDTLAASLRITNEALRNDILEELLEQRRSSGFVGGRLAALEATCAELQRRSARGARQLHSRLDELELEAATGRHRAALEAESQRALLEELKAGWAREAATVRELWQEQARNVHDMRLELEMRCKLSKELVDRYNSLFDRTEALERRGRKLEDSLDRQAANWKALEFRMTESVEYVEGVLREVGSSRGRLAGGVRSCECWRDGETRPIGRLIWRIDGYGRKMEEAVREDSAISSPIFYNREYGYALRLDLYLNGLGQWKNRHVIGCLRIVEGKWDPLLEWPSILTADVVLKDQDNSANDIKKYVKTAKKRRNQDDAEHNSDLYMFIPHTALVRQPGYTRDNVMFLDIRVRDHKLSGSTVSLV